MDLDKIYFLLESKENNNKEIFKVYTKLVSKLGINNAVFFTQILDSLYQLIEDKAIKENESFYINLKDIHDYSKLNMDTIKKSLKEIEKIELYKILNVDTSEYEEEVLINLNLEKIYELLSWRG